MLNIPVLPGVFDGVGFMISLTVFCAFSSQAAGLV